MKMIYYNLNFKDMLNNFQKALISNKECVWEIVKILHPELSLEHKDKIQVYTKYDWVCVTKCGVDIAIEFECTLMSGDKPLYMFEQELKRNKFRCWRFVSDDKYKLENKKEFMYLKDVYNNAVNSILSKYNIPKPTAKQMSNYYHSD